MQLKETSIKLYKLVKGFTPLSFIEHQADAAHGSIEAGLIDEGVFHGPGAATPPAKALFRVLWYAFIVP
jgi:hypothetical protein